MNKVIDLEYVMKNQEVLKRALHDSDPEALYIVGKDLIYNEKYQDVRIAMDLLKLSGDNGYSDAYLERGLVFHRGLLGNVDIRSAILEYQKALKLENPGAMYLLGYVYDRGVGINKDLDKAFYYYKLASKHSVIEAMYKLASFYMNGISCEKDPLKAIYYYIRVVMEEQKEEISKLYTDDSCKYISMNFEDYECHFDEETAIYLDYIDKFFLVKLTRYLVTINSKGIKVENNIIKKHIMMLIDHKVDKSNINDLIYIAELGYADIAKKLGDIFYEGLVNEIGVNHILALKYYQMYDNTFKKSYTKYHNYVLVRLGDLYYNGSGIKHDYDKMINYYKLALDRNINEVVYKLANFYMNVNSSKKNPLKAIYYYIKSLELNDKKNAAAIALDSIDKCYENYDCKVDDETIEFLDYIAEFNLIKLTSYLVTIKDKGVNVSDKIIKRYIMMLVYFSVGKDDIEILEYIAELGYSDIAKKLGDIFYEGLVEGVEINKKLALEYYLMYDNDSNNSYEEYHNEVLERISECRGNELDLLEDSDKYFTNYKLAADSGDPDAIYKLASFYKDGLLIEKNPLKAIYYYAKFVDLEGDEIKELYLDNAYEYISECFEDYDSKFDSETIEYLDYIASYSLVDLIHYLVMANNSGNTVENNLIKKYILLLNSDYINEYNIDKLKKVAQLGYPDVAKILGDTIYNNENNDSKGECLEFYKIYDKYSKNSYEEFNDDILVRIGDCYFFGYGCISNIDTALDYYFRALKFNNKIASGRILDAYLSSTKYNEKALEFISYLVENNKDLCTYFCTNKIYDLLIRLQENEIKANNIGGIVALALSGFYTAFDMLTKLYSFKNEEYEELSKYKSRYPKLTNLYSIEDLYKNGTIELIAYNDSDYDSKIREYGYYGDVKTVPVAFSSNDYFLFNDNNEMINMDDDDVLFCGDSRYKKLVKLIDDVEGK